MALKLDFRKCPELSPLFSTIFFALDHMIIVLFGLLEIPTKLRVSRKEHIRSLTNEARLHFCAYLMTGLIRTLFCGNTNITRYVRNNCHLTKRLFIVPNHEITGGWSPNYAVIIFYSAISKHFIELLTAIAVRIWLDWEIERPRAASWI